MASGKTPRVMIGEFLDSSRTHTVRMNRQRTGIVNTPDMSGSRESELHGDTSQRRRSVDMSRSTERRLQHDRIARLRGKRRSFSYVDVEITPRQMIEGFFEGEASTAPLVRHQRRTSQSGVSASQPALPVSRRQSVDTWHGYTMDYDTDTPRTLIRGILQNPETGVVETPAVTRATLSPLPRSPVAQQSNYNTPSPFKFSTTGPTSSLKAVPSDNKYRTPRRRFDVSIPKTVGQENYDMVVPASPAEYVVPSPFRSSASEEDIFMMHEDPVVLQRTTRHRGRYDVTVPQHLLDQLAAQDRDLESSAQTRDLHTAGQRINHTLPSLPDTFSPNAYSTQRSREEEENIPPQGASMSLQNQHKVQQISPSPNSKRSQSFLSRSRSGSSERGQRSPTENFVEQIAHTANREVHVTPQSGQIKVTPRKGSGRRSMGKSSSSGSKVKTFRQSLETDSVRGMDRQAYKGRDHIHSVTNLTFSPKISSTQKPANEAVGSPSEEPDVPDDYNEMEEEALEAVTPSPQVSPEERRQNRTPQSSRSRSRSGEFESQTRSSQRRLSSSARPRASESQPLDMTPNEIISSRRGTPSNMSRADNQRTPASQSGTRVMTPGHPISPVIAGKINRQGAADLLKTLPNNTINFSPQVASTQNFMSSSRQEAERYLNGLAGTGSDQNVKQYNPDVWEDEEMGGEASTDMGVAQQSGSRTPREDPPPRPKKTTRRPRKKETYSIPTNVVKKRFSHFAGMRVSKEAVEEVMKVSEKYWDHLTTDLLAYAKHANRKRITMDDFQLLFKRQGIVTDKQSLASLIEKYLPMEERVKLLQVARAGNRIEP